MGGTLDLGRTSVDRRTNDEVRRVTCEVHGVWPVTRGMDGIKAQRRRGIMMQRGRNSNSERCVNAGRSYASQSTSISHSRLSSVTCTSYSECVGNPLINLPLPLNSLVSKTCSNKQTHLLGHYYFIPQHFLFLVLLFSNAQSNLPVPPLLACLASLGCTLMYSTL